MKRPVVVAAIDIGTNSVLMLVTRLRADGTITVEQDRAKVTRLGKGVDEHRALDLSAIERTLSTLREFAADAKAIGATIVAVGTSALRDAANPEAFLDPAEQVLGTTIEIISGRREAQLTFLGAIQNLRPKCVGRGAGYAYYDRIMVVDVGGGSSEFIRGKGETLIDAKSIEIGAVRLMERHALEAPASRDQISAINREIRAAIERSEIRFEESLVAVGGTATTLAAVLRGVEPFNAERIHGTVLSRDALRELCERLARMSLLERYAIKGLERERADVIIPGALILLAVQDYARSAQLLVSVGGVRFGLALEAYRKIAIDLDADFA
jgi:exopolyphosphatase/guanosine-5'-triphosphate,3'-diphosphate pyrophosphatase